MEANALWVEKEHACGVFDSGGIIEVTALLNKNGMPIVRGLKRIYHTYEIERFEFLKFSHGNSSLISLRGQADGKKSSKNSGFLQRLSKSLNTTESI